MNRLRRSRSRLIAVLAALFSLGAPAARADVTVLAAEIAPPFVPAQAWFVVSGAASSDAGDRVATLLPPFRADGDTQRVFAGTTIALTDRRAPLTFVVVARSDVGAVWISDPQHLEAAASAAAVGTADELREFLLQRKALLKTRQQQLAEDGDTVEKLQRDAGTIADADRLVDLRAQLAAVDAEMRATEENVALMSALVSLLQAPPVPRNFRRREGDLSAQTAELARVSKSVEASERGRRAEGEAQLQRKLAAIEDTRGDDPEQLAKTLAELRRRRERLERAHGRAHQGGV